MAEVDLIIAGRAYRVACRTGEEDNLRAAARMVDARAKQVQEIVDMLFSFQELGFQEFESMKYLTGILEKEGWAVSEAVSGRDALDHRDVLGLRIGGRRGRVEAVDVGEEHQQVRPDHGGDACGEPDRPDLSPPADMTPSDGGTSAARKLSSPCVNVVSMPLPE